MQLDSVSTQVFTWETIISQKSEHTQHLQKFVCPFFKKRFLFIFREGKGGRETSIDQLPPGTCPNWGLNRNKGTCPDQELNQWPFALWNDAQPNEPYWSQVCTPSCSHHLCPPLHLPRQPLIYFLSLQISLHFLGFYKNWIIQYVILFVWPLTQHNYFEMHSCYCVY